MTMRNADNAVSSVFDGAFIGAFLRQAVNRERVFAEFDGEPITFGRLDDASASLAAALRQRGLARGDRVAMMMRNSIDAMITIFALARAGMVWVPVNVQLVGANLRHILEHSEPAALIVDDELLAAVRASDARLGACQILQRRSAHSDAPSLCALIARAARFEDAAPEGDEVLAISYTSGTTGPAKGVLVTHQMLRYAGEAVAYIADVRENDVLFHWEPFYHIGGAQMLLLPLIRNCRLAMVDRFSASRFWSDVIATRATHIHYLGGMLQILMKQPETALERRHAVRVAWGGGCPESIWRQSEQRFGIAIRESYGMTEASSITTSNRSGEVGAVGSAVPWFEVELLDDQLRRVSPGERGQIVVTEKMPGALFKGYFKNPESTASALRDGRLFTGDLGSWTEQGLLRFHGRMTDSLRCRGENVSAWEIEHVVNGYPGVEEVAVIGVKADIGEQDIKLFVCFKPDVLPDLVALCKWMGGRLASYQNPRYIKIVGSFEKTPSHRILKHRLSTRTDDCWDRLNPFPETIQG